MEPFAQASQSLQEYDGVQIRQILEFFHAAEHVSLLSETHLGKDAAAAQQQRERWLHLLKHRKNGVDRLIRLATAALPERGRRRRQGLKALGHFEEKRSRMRYWEYRAQGLFSGSGLVEAGCQSVAGLRLKQSGMFWSPPGPGKILDIRCVAENEYFGPFWNQRFPVLEHLKQAAWILGNSLKPVTSLSCTLRLSARR